MAKTFSPDLLKRVTRIFCDFFIHEKAVMAGIERTAAESTKTPNDVVRFQNYHHLSDLLSSLRIESLSTERKSIKGKVKF